MSYHVGGVWVATATVIDPASETIVEPSAITFTFVTPTGASIVGVVTKVALGVYESSVQLTEAGPWQVSVLTTGTYEASQPDSIDVLERYG